MTVRDYIRRLVRYYEGRTQRHLSDLRRERLIVDIHMLIVKRLRKYGSPVDLEKRLVEAILGLDQVKLQNEFTDHPPGVI